MEQQKSTLFILFSLVICTWLPAQTQSSDFYNTDSIQEIKIKFDSDNWRFLLDSLRFNGSELLEATVDINGSPFEGAGVRIKKDRVFIPDQKKNSLFIRLDYKNPGQNYQGSKGLMLSLSLRDPSMVREVLGLEIARKYMPAPKANFAKVQVNDDYYGLFVNIEPIDNQFLADNFSATDGQLFYSNPAGATQLGGECLNNANGNLRVEEDIDCYKNNFDLVKGDNYQALAEVVAAINAGTDNLEELLDIDQTLWFLAFHNLFANLSSYLGKEAPNYFLYQDSNGQFSPIIWNLNFIIGTYKNLGRGSDLSVEQLIELDPFLHIDNQLKPLVSRLLNNTKNQKLYRSHLRTLIYEEILSGQFEARAKALQAQIEVPFTNDPNRYYETADFDKSLVAVIGKVSKVPGIVTFMNERARFLKKHAELIYIPSEISNVTYTRRERFSSKRVQKYQIQATVSNFTNRVDIFYRFSEDGPFQKMSMEDNGKHNDGDAGDNIYGITVRPAGESGKIQYYIRVENPKTFGYLPNRYMNEYQEISLAELNK